MGRLCASGATRLRADWFSSEAPVIDLKTYQASQPSAENDLVVLPETLAHQCAQLPAGHPQGDF